MFSLVSFYVLIGAVLGLRFTVMVLPPAIALSAVVIIGINVAWGTGLWMAAIETVIAVTSVQIGYLVGVGVRIFLDRSRLSVAAMSRSHLALHGSYSREPVAAGQKSSGLTPVTDPGRLAQPEVSGPTCPAGDGLR